MYLRDRQTPIGPCRAQCREHSLSPICRGVFVTPPMGLGAVRRCWWWCYCGTTRLDVTDKQHQQHTTKRSTLVADWLAGWLARRNSDLHECLSQCRPLELFGGGYRSYWFHVNICQVICLCLWMFRFGLEIRLVTKRQFGSILLVSHEAFTFLCNPQKTPCSTNFYPASLDV